jgi:hypothetical protein
VAKGACPVCHHAVSLHRWDEASADATSPPEYYCHAGKCGCDWGEDRDDSDEGPDEYDYEADDRAFRIDREDRFFGRH